MNQNPYQAPSAKMNVSSSYDTEPNNSRWYSLKGRIGRLRYFTYPYIFVFLLFFPAVIFGFINAAFDDHTDAKYIAMLIVMIIGGIFYIVLLFYWLLIYPIRRLHDLGRSGWLVLITLVPLINIIFYFYLLFAPGDERENEHGAPPRENKWFHWAGATLGVAIVVIGILAAISIPAYNQYIKRAQADQLIQSQSN